MSSSAELPAVSFHINCGSILRDLGISHVDVNYRELLRLLREVGEFDNESSSPIDIVFVDSVDHDNDSTIGLARSHGPDRSVITRRSVLLPLTLATRTGDGLYSLSLDTDRINKTAAHELQHIADFQNPVVMARQRDDEKHVRREYRRKLLEYRTQQFLGGLVGKKIIINKDLIKSNLMKETTLEKRASFTANRLEEDGILPQILEFNIKEQQLALLT